MIALSNLLPTVRMNKENLITVAIWAGESKPLFDKLLAPLKHLFSQLARGIQVLSPVGVKIMTFQPLFGVFDGHGGVCTVPS